MNWRKVVALITIHFHCSLFPTEIVFSLRLKFVSAISGKVSWKITHKLKVRGNQNTRSSKSPLSQNNETAAMLVSQISPLGVELFSYPNAFFWYNKFAYMLAMWVETLYRWWTVNKRSLISSFCLSTSICSFHQCYLCLPRLHENHL